ncbi:MAG: circularly permuted type 2 ATP-grasp protein [Planctomycetota bacterium]
MSSTTGTVSAHPAGEFASLYQPSNQFFDEMVPAGGGIRPAWAQFVPRLDELGADGLTQCTEQARRLLRENGVTYNVYGASQDLERPWDLDPLPILLQESEWQPLSEAVQQRALLLDRLLADIYGPQTVLKSGVLPPHAIFQHPGYLRPCAGIVPPGGVFLHWYAAQLARRPDGGWTVLGDRTQGPSGAGYAVENRIIVSRTLPQDFQSSNVVRLAPFFITLRNTLANLARQHRDNPRVVLLTPGPSSSRYFEDVYLARYLGYALVEGGDLTVRGVGVYLKTLGGLLPVDVILRRMVDSDCDPLELQPDSIYGIPGLVQAARDGQVVIANALGSGFLEAPILQPYLPAICRHLLGEELRLLGARTWWCGHREQRQYVEANIDRLVIRPAFRQRKVKTHAGWLLSREQKTNLLAEIQAHPAQFVAQEPIPGSTAPIWNGTELQPWHVTFRAYAVADDGGYQIMPGGLSRVAPRSEMLTESMTAGQRSKDVWILADRPVESVSLLRPPSTALELRRTGNDLPSRAADHLFWLGRLIERSEAKVRHVRSVVARMTSELQPAGLAELHMLLVALDEPGESPVADLSLSDPEAWPKLREAVWEFLYNPKRPGGLLETLQNANRTASIVRDRISIDGWRIVNQLELHPQIDEDDTVAVDLAEALMPLNHQLTLLSAFSGLSTDSMTRGPGWRFLDIGRRIERALQTVRLIRGLLVDAQADLLPRLEAMLEIADSSMTYRYRYLTTLQLAPVLDLVLVDETNPRAVGFQLFALAEHVKNLSRDRGEFVRSPEQKLMLAAQAALRLVDVEAFCSVNGLEDRVLLDDFLEHVASDLRSLSDSITHTYLTHTAPARQLDTLVTAKT